MDNGDAEYSDGNTSEDSDYDPSEDTDDKNFSAEDNTDNQQTETRTKECMRQKYMGTQD